MYHKIQPSESDYAGIPSGVTDLKAAIRYIRANLDVLPGSADRVVAYGHSGGGSQTAVLGASGDRALYEPYLTALGAADASDAVNAAMCWCPITGFDSADEGHEWSMGVTRSGLDDGKGFCFGILKLIHALSDPFSRFWVFPDLES